MMGNDKQSDIQVKMSEALEKVAGELGTESVTAVALAYVLQKTTHVFPVSGRTPWPVSVWHLLTRTGFTLTCFGAPSSSVVER